jgi:hypothetical protein
MTAMFENAMNERVNNDKDRFTMTELAALQRFAAGRHDRFI